MERLSPGVWIAAGAKLALHLATNQRYGYFGDELYYLACADHLAWGYVDHPPFSIALLAAWGSIFGDSLVSVRFPSALVGAASVLLAGMLARSLGGGGWAQSLAAICLAISGVNLVLNGYYSMNAIDVLVWMGAFYLLAGLLERPSPARWLALGLLLGVGLLNKISVLWFGAGLGVALVATSYRRLLFSPWPWLAAALAALVFAPHLLWQLQNGWPTAEFVRVATAEKMVPVGPVELFAQQILVMHPLTAPFWVAGLAWLLIGPGCQRFRPFGLIFLVVAAILIASGTSRPNYLALAQPPLLAGGAIWLEALSRGRRMKWPAPAASLLLVVAGLAVAPLVVPVLPVRDVITYRAWLGIGAPQMEHREIGELDPHFADMHGWPQIVAGVARAHAALPEVDRSRVAVLSHNYGDAGAVDLLGRAQGLPGAISTHNSYWLWGRGEASGEVLLVMGGPEDLLRAWYTDVREVGRITCRYCQPVRRDRPLWLARGPRRPFDEFWRAMRHYD